MHWKDELNSSRRRNEEGFTFIEILASLLLLAIIGIGAWQAGIIGTRVLSTSASRSIQTIHLLQLDEALRRDVGNIRFPYWINQVETDESFGRIEIPYFYGDFDSKLILSVNEDTLVISNSITNIERTYGPFEDIELTLERDASSNPIGIQILVKVRQAQPKPNALALRFGSNPLWNSHE